MKLLQVFFMSSLDMVAKTFKVDVIRDCMMLLGHLLVSLLTTRKTKKAKGLRSDELGGQEEEEVDENKEG